MQSAYPGQNVSSSATAGRKESKSMYQEALTAASEEKALGGKKPLNERKSS